MSVQKFRKKPVVIEAMQWDGNNWSDVQSFTRIAGAPHTGFADYSSAGEGPDGHLYVAANHSWLPIDVGEWIIKDAKPDIFEATYEAVR